MISFVYLRREAEQNAGNSEVIQIKLNRVKNPNRPEANHLAIYEPEYQAFLGKRGKMKGER